MTATILTGDFLSVQDIEDYYVKNIALHGLKAPRTMGYHTGPIDPRLIINLLPESLPASYSVLDVGCGLGQIIPILEGRFQGSKLAELVGLDIVGQFVSHCAQQYQKHQFVKVNFLEWEMERQFDLVLAAGVLVTRIPDFESYLKKFIQKMVLASKNFVAFNVIASLGPRYTAKHLASITEENLKDLLAAIPGVTWKIEKKEVFPGSEDIFVRGGKNLLEVGTA